MIWQSSYSNKDSKYLRSTVWDDRMGCSGGSKKSMFLIHPLRQRMCQHEETENVPA